MFRSHGNAYILRCLRNGKHPVLYLRIVSNTGEVQVTFGLGKAKLTAAHATITPRLELWAAVLGVEMSELVHKELEQKPDSVTYYSDSKFILAITN